MHLLLLHLHHWAVLLSATKYAAVFNRERIILHTYADSPQNNGLREESLIISAFWGRSTTNDQAVASVSSIAPPPLFPCSLCQKIVGCMFCPHNPASHMGRQKCFLHSLQEIHTLTKYQTLIPPCPWTRFKPLQTKTNPHNWQLGSISLSLSLSLTHHSQRYYVSSRPLLFTHLLPAIQGVHGAS